MLRGWANSLPRKGLWLSTPIPQVVKGLVDEGVAKDEALLQESLWNDKTALEDQFGLGA